MGRQEERLYLSSFPKHEGVSYNLRAYLNQIKSGLNSRFFLFHPLSLFPDVVIWVYESISSFSVYFRISKHAASIIKRKLFFFYLIKYTLFFF